MLNTFEAFSIFCALTIGGGIMALPMAMSQSGWLLSIIVLCAVPFYFLSIYLFLIDLMKKGASSHLHILISNFYGQYFSLFCSALIVCHIYLLLCLMIIREAKLIEFLINWTLTRNEDSKQFKQYTVLILCFLLLVCGNYKGFKSFRWISLLNLAGWIYFIWLAISDVLFNDKIKTLSVPVYNFEEADEIVWSAIEAFNSIHGIALLYYDVNDADVTGKAIKYGLWTAFLVSSSAAWLGSRYHLGNLNLMSMIHVSLDLENLKEIPFSWSIFTGLVALIISLFILALLVLNPVRVSLAHLIEYKEKHFTEEAFNRRPPLMIFTGLLLFGVVFFSFDNIPLLITFRRIMLFIFCVLNPYLFYIKEDGPMFKKILYGVSIVLFLVFICSINPELKGLILTSNDKEL